MSSFSKFLSRIFLTVASTYRLHGSGTQAVPGSGRAQQLRLQLSLGTLSLLLPERLIQRTEYINRQVLLNNTNACTTKIFRTDQNLNFNIDTWSPWSVPTLS